MRDLSRLGCRKRDFSRALQKQENEKPAKEIPDVAFSFVKDQDTMATVATLESDYGDRQIKHVVELSELTVVHQTLSELCDELLKD